MRPILYFFLHNTPPPEIYTLSLHDALPISERRRARREGFRYVNVPIMASPLKPRERRVREALLVRSEEHTSELQSRGQLVCRLLLGHKKPARPSCPFSEPRPAAGRPSPAAD